MCGISGFIDTSITDLGGVSRRMSAALTHRGPDDVGHWQERDFGIALGHRRLSILELSPAGHQPMQSHGGRYVMVFNGEIYNHLAIRTELARCGAAPLWRGRSDTETLLASIEAWGWESALRRCTGMFALAVWDRQLRRLLLARDRAGEKPLYYARHGDAFLFASELKALQVHPAFRSEIDRESLASFLRFSYVPDPRSIFKGVSKLPPATYLEVNERGLPGQPVLYWQPTKATSDGHSGLFSGSDTEALQALERVLGDAVEAQMVADVPLGAFLSGGIDSSLIVALMQKRASAKVRTFTIGFAEAAYDESRYARKVAEHLGTDHTELVVTPAEAMNVIPNLPAIFDEPFGDSSQIPTYLVAKLARRHVTVSLSGDAGDELFGGYNRYTWAKRFWATLDIAPRGMRRFAASCIRSRSPQAWNRTLRPLTAITPRKWRATQMGDKLHKIADLLAIESREEAYHGLVSHWPDPGAIVVGANEPRSQLLELMAQTSGRSFEEDMMYWDLLTYLPGDILVKVDRAAMAVSLETRVPMLDHRVIEFAWSLPLHMRVRAGESKWLPKQLLYQMVPRALIDRPKMGFGVPIDSWLRGPLREWAEELLDVSRLRSDGFLHPDPIRCKWEEHLSATRNWAYWLWDVLMFQAWLQVQKEHRNELRLAARDATACAF